jgi:hypothetical protein
MRPYEILEMVQTGAIALERGEEALNVESSRYSWPKLVERFKGPQSLCRYLRSSWSFIGLKLGSDKMTAWKGYMFDKLLSEGENEKWVKNVLRQGRKLGHDEGQDCRRYRLRQSGSCSYP